MKHGRYLIVLCMMAIVLSLQCIANSIAAPPNESPVKAAADITPAESQANPAKNRLWNLQDADILSIINEVSLETGKNFVVDPRVTGKISLVSSQPIKSSDVYQLFLSILSLLGYSAIPSGNVVKIVPNIEGGTYATPIASSHQPGKGDEVVIRIIPLTNVSATQLVPIIRPLLPQWSTLSAYTPGNILILLGRASNLSRVIDLIHQMDQESDSGSIDVVPLRRSSASQMGAVLAKLTAGNHFGDLPQATIAIDERTNSILLSGNKRARLRMRALITQLDLPSPQGGSPGNTEVIYLRYLQAKKFAPLLGKVAENILGKGTDATGGASSSSSSGDQGGNANPVIIGGAGGGSRGGSSAKKAGPENKTSIQAEPSTNSLIITAPPAMMRALQHVITQLDIRPSQVLVEGIIVEINQDDLKQLGFQWGAFVTNDEIAQTSQDGFPPLGKGNIMLLPKLTTKFKTILQFIQNNTNANILSTPSIVVLDNQPALVSVGQNIALQSGAYSTTGGTTSSPTPFNTFDRKDVVLKLQVKPQINQGDSVRMIIKLQNDSLLNPDNPGLNPQIKTSKIENAVIVHSGDVLVLGGLLDNTVAITTDQVPVLGDLPVIGRLFQYKTKRLQKRSLLVFLKPTIMHDQEMSNVLTNTKYDVIREDQINWPAKLSVGKAKRDNILPLRGASNQLPEPFESNG